MPPSYIEQEETQIGREVVKEPAAICEVSTTASAWSVVASPTINRVAREENVDHIVMGTRGLGGVSGVLLGSVTTQVLQLGDVPVTFVK